MRFILNISLLIAIIISGCSIKKLVELEQYEYAIDMVVGKLNRKPNDFETYDLLQKSYGAIESKKLEVIEEYLNDTTPNWDVILKNYEELQEVQQKVNQLKFQQSKIEIQNIDKDFEFTKQEAAQSKFDKAVALIQNNPTKTQFQNAYYLLNEAQALNPNTNGIEDLIDSTKKCGITRVVFSYVNPNGFEFPDLFYDQLNKIDLTDFNNEWIIFYPTYQEKFQYDFTLNVTFDKFQIQNKESVIFSYTDRKTLENNNESEEIKARVERIRKHQSIYIKGELQLIDNLAMNTFEMYPLQAFYNWQNEDAKFTGDKRALSPKSIDLLYVPFDETAQYKNAFSAAANDIIDDVKLYLFYVGHKLENKPTPNLFR